MQPMKRLLKFTLRLILGFVILSVLISPMVWILDVLQETIVVYRLTTPSRETLEITEKFNGVDFYHRELRHFVPGRKPISVVLNPDASKAWIASIRAGPATNLFDIYFLRYHGTYDILSRSYIYRDGTQFTAVED
jgi:hypothetical protein